jgi:hypothetical protein
MKAALTWTSLFTAAAGVWLALMENILKHSGYAGRTAIAACIAIQSLATLLFLFLHGRSMFRAVVITGAAGVTILGASAINKILAASHFEGFVLVIGFALIAQGLLTIVVVSPAHSRHA